MKENENQEDETTADITLHSIPHESEKKMKINPKTQC